jgi:hypothetical protein
MAISNGTFLDANGAFYLLEHDANVIECLQNFVNGTFFNAFDNLLCHFFG